MNSARPLFEIESLSVHFSVRKSLFAKSRILRAVDGVSLFLHKGRTLGLVGESGCGKTTLIRAALGLQAPTAGEVRLDGQTIVKPGHKMASEMRPRIQLVFQDPLSALDPRMTVHEAVAEPLRLQRRYDRAHVEDLLKRVGLSDALAGRRPSQLSGGQRQRVGIARALALNPAVLVLDEPVSALDISVQAQVINLLADVQEEMGLSFLFVAHDLSVVHHVSHDIAVMYLGRIVEYGSRNAIFSTPAHPYTQMLLNAAPQPDPSQRMPATVTRAELPDPMREEAGCAFRSRCSRSRPRCAAQAPSIEAFMASSLGIPHMAACWYPLS